MNKKFKKCKRCNINLDISFFYVCKSGVNKGKIRSYCKSCTTNAAMSYMKAHPWMSSLQHIRDRCRNTRHHNYHRYGGRGIKNLLSVTDIKFLWMRDDADSMKKPTVDRINVDGNYSIENCRFIEHSLNATIGNAYWRKIKSMRKVAGI